MSRRQKLLRKLVKNHYKLKTPRGDYISITNADGTKAVFEWKTSWNPIWTNSAGEGAYTFTINMGFNECEKCGVIYSSKEEHSSSKCNDNLTIEVVNG